MLLPYQESSSLKNCETLPLEMMPLPAGPSRTPVASVAIKLMISGFWLTGGVVPSGSRLAGLLQPGQVQVLEDRLIGGEVLERGRGRAVGEDGGPQLVGLLGGLGHELGLGQRRGRGVDVELERDERDTVVIDGTPPKPRRPHTARARSARAPPARC